MLSAPMSAYTQNKSAYTFGGHTHASRLPFKGLYQGPIKSTVTEDDEIMSTLSWPHSYVPRSKASKNSYSVHSKASKALGSIRG